jgi:ubiquinone/menaquinone biosynthesis C-methylase UbiE
VEDTRTRAARTHFDRWSASYEHDAVSRRMLELQSAALAALSLDADDALLDLGCGTGAAVREAATTVRRAVGFDLSPGMIERARVLADGLRNVEFRQGDVSGALPFADGEFTAIVCTSAFHHFPRPGDTVAEMARVLSPGGRALIADANRCHPAVFALDLALRVLQPSHVGFRSPVAIRRDLRAGGFTRTQVQTMLGRSYALILGYLPRTTTAPEPDTTTAPEPDTTTAPKPDTTNAPKPDTTTVPEPGGTEST